MADPIALEFTEGAVVKFLRDKGDPYDKSPAEGEAVRPLCLQYMSPKTDGSHGAFYANVHLMRAFFVKLAECMVEDNARGIPFFINERFSHLHEWHFYIDFDFKRVTKVGDADIVCPEFDQWNHDDHASLRDVIKLFALCIGDAYMASYLKSYSTCLDVIVWSACRQGKISYHLHYPKLVIERTEAQALAAFILEKCASTTVHSWIAHQKVVDPAVYGGNLRMPYSFRCVDSADGKIPGTGQLKFLGVFSKDGMIVEPSGKKPTDRLYCDRFVSGSLERSPADMLRMCMQNAYQPLDFRRVKLMKEKRTKVWSDEMRIGADGVVSMPLKAKHSFYEFEFVLADADVRYITLALDTETCDSPDRILRNFRAILETQSPKLAMQYLCQNVGFFSHDNKIRYKVKNSLTGICELVCDSVTSSLKHQWGKVMIKQGGKKADHPTFLVDIFIANSYKYSGFFFLPFTAVDDDMPNLMNGRLNTWIAYACYHWNYESVSMDAILSFGLSAVSRILFHIWDILCDRDDDLFVAYVSFLAHIIQFPDIRTMRCPVLFGREGTGKSLIAETLMALGLLGRGRHALVCENAGHLLGEFNASLADKTYLVFSESLFSGNKQLISRCRHLITGETTSMTKKHEDPREIQNYANCTIITNEESNPITGLDNRRFIFLHARDTWACAPFGMDQETFKQAKKVYMSALDASCSEHDGQREFALFLRFVDLSNWLRNRHTLSVGDKAAGKIKANSLPEEAGLIRDLITAQCNISPHALADYGNLCGGNGRAPACNFDANYPNWCLDPPRCLFVKENKRELHGRYSTWHNVEDFLNSKLNVTLDNGNPRRFRFPSFRTFSDTFDRLYPNLNARTFMSQSQAISDAVRVLPTEQDIIDSFPHLLSLLPLRGSDDAPQVPDHLPAPPRYRDELSQSQGSAPSSPKKRAAVPTSPRKRTARSAAAPPIVPLSVASEDSDPEMERARNNYLGVSDEETSGEEGDSVEFDMANCD